MGYTKYFEDDNDYIEERVSKNSWDLHYNGYNYIRLQDSNAIDYFEADKQRFLVKSFLVANYNCRIDPGRRCVSKLTMLKLHYCALKKMKVSLILDRGRLSQRSVCFYTESRKKEYDLFPKLPYKGFYTLDVLVGDISFEVQQEISLSSLTIEDVKSHTYPLDRFQDLFDKKLTEIEYLRYLQILLAEHSDEQELLGYFEYLQEIDAQSESLGWYCLLATQNLDLVQIPSITALWKGVYNLLNGNYKLALKYLDDEKESNVLHGCYQICWMLEGISGNEEYWKTPYQNKGCGILGTIHRVLTALSEYTVTNPKFPLHNDIEELTLFVQYPLVQAIINFQDTLQHETALKDDDYLLLKNLSPWVALPFCCGKRQDEVDSILQSTFENFPSDHQFKEYAHRTLFANRLMYFLPEDGAFYQAALHQANNVRKNPFPDNILNCRNQTEKIELLPLGGASKIGASCFLVTYQGFSVLLDCGIDPKQADEDVYAGISALNCNIDAIIISHAHLDHSGAVPVAHEAWPEAKIYATGITEMFLEHLYADMAKVKNDPSGTFEIENISYDRRIMQDTLNHIEIVKCEQWVQMTKEIQFRFHTAGHLLGAAMIELRINQKTILYTGDWSAHEQNLTPAVEYKNLLFEPDLLLCEATYIKKATSSWEQSKEELERGILDGVQSGQSILLPANAMGRSQELACLIGEMKQDGRLPEKTELWIAGMASAITLESASFMNAAYANVIGQYRIFDGSYWPEQNCIVIASSSTLAPGSASAQIRKHWAEKQIPCRIIHNGGWHSPYSVQNETIFSCSLPTHASRTDIKELINKLQPKSVAFVHQGGRTVERPQLLAELQKEITKEKNNSIICYTLTEQQLAKPFDLLYMMQKGTCYDG